MPTPDEYKAAEEAVRNGSATAYQKELNNKMASTASGKSARDAQVNSGLNKEYGQGPNQHDHDK